MINPLCPLCGNEMIYDAAFDDYYCPDCEYFDDELPIDWLPEDEYEPTDYDEDEW